MRRTLALLLLALAGAWPCCAAPHVPFDAGNAHYQQGQYEQARQQYLAQAQQGPVTPSVWYNLGNASLKLEQPGWAILYYQRAALTTPRNRDLRANLAVALASRRVPPSAEAPGWFEFVWQNLLQALTLNELTVAATFFYLMACALLVWRLHRRLFRRRYVWLVHAALGLLLITGSLAGGKWRSDYDASRAVVVADASLYSGPADTFPAVRTVYQGELAHLTRHEGFWRELDLENGARGWVQQSAVEPVVP